MKKIAVFGATSAIATACSRLWAEQGSHFCLVGRQEERLQQVADDLISRGATAAILALDFNELDQHGKVLDRCFSELSHVDIALVAYGTLPDQEACEQDERLLVQAFSTTGLSVINLLTGLANRLEAQGAGTLAVLSSVAGDRGRASNYVYGAAKAAITAFCSGLRSRLLKSGVNVLVIKPGFVKTPMTEGIAFPPLLVATPERVACDISRAIDRRRDSLYTPWFWRYIMLIITHLPEPLFKRLKL